MIAIIPIGGNATRIHSIPKYLLPLPDGTLLDVLLSRVQDTANVRQIVLMSKGFNTPLLQRMELYDALIVERDDISMSHAVMLAREFVQPDENVLFAMPDTWWEDSNAFRKLAAALDDGAEVAVGCFYMRAGQHVEGGNVDIYESTKIKRVIDKPAERETAWIWGVLAWKPVFWQHMNASDPHVGYALPRAIEAGLDVRAVVMDMEGGYWDCGTTERYFALINHLTREAVTI